MPNRSRLTYANVVSTIALFLAVSGGIAFAAGQIGTKDIAKRAVTSGKIALGAVRSNQIADGAVSRPQLGNGAVGPKQLGDGAVGAAQLAAGAVGAGQIADGAVGSKQVGSAAIAPANLAFPVYYPASPLGGSIPVPDSEPVAYPLSDASWTQSPGQINVVFGGARGTLAYNGNGGSCRVFIEVSVNGQQVGGGELSTDSMTPKTIEQTVGAQPAIDPPAPVENRLTSRVASNEGCTPESTLESVRFRVLDFG